MNENINKRKVINDPVYGFITLPSELLFDIIEHPYFQRLRRIQQLGLTNLVYPGAYHTRFHHAVGSMHLMMQAIEVLRSKGAEISAEEAEGALIAILLHDIGHGPFSHALENTLIDGAHHEDLSLAFMNRLNEEFQGKLSTGIAIFKGEHPKRFLHQLVSSQLDMDRLDYLRRDSFYTGVNEGVIGVNRIIKMLTLVDGEIAVEAKGIYSIEKFLVARRIMYWQVYLHKTVLSAEFMLLNILKRAKELAIRGMDLFCTPALKVFLYQSIDPTLFVEDRTLLDQFAQLDDSDILTSIKVWQTHEDPALSYLCKAIVNRKLLKIEIKKQPFSPEVLLLKRQEIADQLGISVNETHSLVFEQKLSIQIYDPKKKSNQNINENWGIIRIQ